MRTERGSNDRHPKIMANNRGEQLFDFKGSIEKSGIQSLRFEIDDRFPGRLGTLR